MDLTALKHTHTLLVSLFVLHYIVKTILMLTGSSSFASYRKKMLVPEMILAILFLITGIWMLVQIGMGGLGGWFHLKLTLVILAIPLGIIGFKRGIKPLAILSTLIFIYIFGIAWTKSFGIVF